MKRAERDSVRLLAATLIVSLGTCLAGCGIPGAPRPPSLNLPDRVADLSATRVGNQVSLTWTMPKRNTDKLPLKDKISVRMSRREGANDRTTEAGDLQLAAAEDGTFSETLPVALTTGAPRSLTYFVECNNRSGRSAGLSNPATVVAGEPPAPVTGLAAEVRKQGAILRWNPADPPAAIRLHRRLLTPPATKPRTGPLPPTPEPVEQNFL